MSSYLDQFLATHRLKDSFRHIVEQYYQPLAEQVFRCLGERPFVLGINGAQGTGKSTLADFIRCYLAEVHAVNVVSLSIDDIYLTKAERQVLAEKVHPLLITRGVPGTHDVALGVSVIDKLKSLQENETVTVTRFDKSVDDRCHESVWSEVSGPIDLIILEGWCVGSEPESAVSLAEPVNELERDGDPDSTWRKYVNACLENNYRALFDQLDALVLLKAPDFESVFRWRLEQEQKLALDLAAIPGCDTTGIMSAEEIARFIQHYERITRRNLEDLAKKADVVIDLGQDHQITGFSSKLPSSAS